MRNLFIVILIIASCNYNKKNELIIKNKIMITKEKAMEVAKQNAQLYYKDLSIYIITIQQVDSNWKVDYELKDATLDGGGPHYIISGKSGDIIKSHFDQ